MENNKLKDVHATVTVQFADGQEVKYEIVHHDESDAITLYRSINESPPKKVHEVILQPQRFTLEAEILTTVSYVSVLIKRLFGLGGRGSDQKGEILQSMERLSPLEQQVLSCFPAVPVNRAEIASRIQHIPATQLERIIDKLTDAGYVSYGNDARYHLTGEHPPLK